MCVRTYLLRQLADETEAGLEIRSLIKTKVPKIEYHRYAARTDSHFRRFFQIVRAYLDDLDRGDFVYRPGFGCTMCDVRFSRWALRGCAGVTVKCPARQVTAPVPLEATPRDGSGVNRDSRYQNVIAIFYLSAGA
jgi:hypothetical protein